jgi:hypothetical protein
MIIKIQFKELTAMQQAVDILQGLGYCWCVERYRALPGDILRHWESQALDSLTISFKERCFFFDSCSDESHWIHAIKVITKEINLCRYTGNI